MFYSSSELISATLQSMPEAIVVINSQGIIHLINDSACRLLAIISDKALGSLFVYLPDGGATISPYEREWNTYVNNQHLFFRATPITESDKKYVGTLIMIMDGLPEKTASESLKSLSHELVTPTSAILICTELLLNNGEVLTNKQREWIIKIKEKATYIRTLQREIF
jgi:hypothetical protein